MRLVKLAQILEKENNQIYILGLEKAKELENSSNMRICRNLEQVLENAEIVISSIPFTRDGITINMPLSDNKIKINEFMNLMKDKTLIAGTIPNNIYEKYKGVEIIDIMKNEKLAILNTIATAEGAIKELIANTDIIIHGAKILILGYGSIAKTSAQKLKGIDAKVTIAARKEEALAWGYTYGFNVVNINSIEEKLANYDIIVNTVPELILGKQQIKNIKSKTYLLDISSAPGGIDFEEANKNNIKAELALGLPGKYAPYTTAKFIKDVIEELCK